MCAVSFLSDLNWVPHQQGPRDCTFHIWGGGIQIFIRWVLSQPPNIHDAGSQIVTPWTMLGFWLYQAKGGSELYCNQDTWNQEVINNGGAGRILLALSFTAHLPLLQCGFFRNVCMALFSSDCLRFRAGFLICVSGTELECRPLKTHQWVGGIDTPGQLQGRGGFQKSCNLTYCGNVLDQTSPVLWIHYKDNK